MEDRPAELCRPTEGFLCSACSLLGYCRLQVEGACSPEEEPEGGCCQPELFPDSRSDASAGWLEGDVALEGDVTVGCSEPTHAPPPGGGQGSVSERPELPHGSAADALGPADAPAPARSPSPGPADFPAQPGEAQGS